MTPAEARMTPRRAMALNGGLAGSGGACGAITGAALAVGQLAARQSHDHRAAKSAARQVIAQLMVDFTTRFGSTACRELTGVNLDTEAGHRQFIESGVWRDGCPRCTSRWSPVAHQLRLHGIEVTRHDLAHRFGLERPAEGGRTLEVGEHDRHQLALLRLVDRDLERRAAEPAQTESTGVLLATAGAGKDHERISVLGMRRRCAATGACAKRWRPAAAVPGDRARGR